MTTPEPNEKPPNDGPKNGKSRPMNIEQLADQLRRKTSQDLAHKYGEPIDWTKLARETKLIWIHIARNVLHTQEAFDAIYPESVERSHG